MISSIENNTINTSFLQLKEIDTFPEEMKEKKESAFQNFERMGFPTMKHEEWKYTYLNKILKKGFYPGGNISSTADWDIIAQKLPKTPSYANRAVIVDGIFSKELSSIAPSAAYTISSFSEIWATQPALFNSFFASISKDDTHALTALNTAFFQDGLWIHISEGQSTELELIFVYTDRLQMSMPRIGIQVEDSATLRIHEQHILTNGENFSNAVTEVKLGTHAKLEWAKFQNAGDEMYQLDTIYVEQGDKSSYHCDTLSISGQLLRNQQFVDILGEEAHVKLGGVYILEANQQTDNLIIINHLAPNSTSDQLYKGILDDKSTGVFNGKVVVQQAAQKTNAFQSNKNILLSDDAAAYFRPQLEIFADDVKCSHGATSAQIEDHELFYLRSRGISKELSKSLLMYAFANDVVEDIEDENLRNLAKSLIASQLKIELS